MGEAKPSPHPVGDFIVLCNKASSLVRKSRAWAAAPSGDVLERQCIVSMFGNGGAFWGHTDEHWTHMVLQGHPGVSCSATVCVGSFCSLSREADTQ